MKHFALKLRRWAAGIEPAAEAAVSAAALRGAEAARQLAPVDSGELRGGIVARHGGLQAEVVSSAAHSAMVEFGTSRAAAQPYLLPMAREMRGEFSAGLGGALKEVLK